MDLAVVLNETELEARAAPFGAAGAFRYSVVVDRAKRPRPFAPILQELLRESGDSLFQFRGLSFENKTTLRDDEIFVPPSVLKAAKNALYTALDAAFLAGVEARAGGAGVEARAGGAAVPGRSERAEAGHGVPRPVAGGVPLDLSPFGDRACLSPPAGVPIPYVANPSGISAAQLALVGGFRAVPLPPFIPVAGAWIEALDRLAAANSGERFAIGLNNPSHIEMARALARPIQSLVLRGFPSLRGERSGAAAAGTVCASAPFRLPLD